MPKAQVGSRSCSKDLDQGSDQERISGSNMCRWSSGKRRNGSGVNASCCQRVGQGDGLESCVRLGCETVQINLVQQHRGNEKPDPCHPAPQVEFPRYYADVVPFQCPRENSVCTIEWSLGQRESSLRGSPTRRRLSSPSQMFFVTSLGPLLSSGVAVIYALLAGLRTLG